MNVRNIPERWASSLVAVVGIGGVTLVLIAVLSIAAGFRQALELSGSQDVAIILRSGSTNEMSSGFGQNQVTLIATRRASSVMDKSKPIVSAELYVLTEGKLKGKDDASGNLPFRGVSSTAPMLRKSFKIEKGTMMREGTNEIIVGNGVVDQLRGLEVGKTVRWGNADWKIVGRLHRRWRHRRIRSLGAMCAWCSRSGIAARASSRCARASLTNPTPRSRSSRTR